MNGFDKLFRKSKVAKTTNSTKQDQWLRNVRRSVGKTTLDVVKEFVPATMETAVSMRDMQRDLRESLVNTKKVGIMKTGSLMSLGKSIWQNSLEDLKSGNFYNQERLSEAENNMFGLNLDSLDAALNEDFDIGEDDNYDFDITSEDGQSSVQMNHTSDSGNDITQINIETNLGKDSTLVQATQAQTEISIKTAQELANVSVNNTKVLLSHLSKMSATIDGQLASLNENVGAIATVVSESMPSHYSIAEQYYQDSLSIFNNINETLTGISEIIKNGSSTDQTATKVNPWGENSVLNIFSNGLNLPEYFKLVKKQAKGALSLTPLGSIMAAGQLMSLPGANPIDEFKSSPISGIVKMITKAVIPEAIKTASEKLDKTLKETLVTGLFRVGGLRQSLNPLLQFIGNTFGIKTSIYKTNKANYNKGPMAWNGIAHRTLVDVIPTYLSQIASAVTGTEQKVFDYQNGKYESLNKIRENHEETERRTGLSNFSDIRSEFSSFLSNFNLNDDAKKKYSGTFDDYLFKIVKGGGAKTFTNLNQLKMDVGGDETIAKFIQQFMRYAPKDVVMSTYGRNAIRSAEDLSRLHREMEADPTAYNSHYINNGMSVISGNQNGLLKDSKDSYGNDMFFYIRKILQTINTVVPVRIISGGKGFNRRILREIGFTTAGSGENSGTDRGDSTNGSSGTHANIPYDLQFFADGTQNGLLSLNDINGTPEELQRKLKERNNKSNTQNNDPKILKLLKKLKVKETSNLYKLAKNAAKAKKNATGKGVSIFNTLSDMMFNLLFGEGDKKGFKGAISVVVDKVKGQMKKFGNFIDEKVIGKLNDSLFGEEGLITKINDSESIKKFKESVNKMKTRATDFLFGEKGEDGKRKNGLFSETLNSLSDMGKEAKNFILKDEDGVVSNIKGMFKSVTSSIKKAVGVEADEEKPKTSISEKISGGAKDFLTHIKSRGSEWIDLIFGKDKKDKEETATAEIQQEFEQGLEIFKSDMKGKKGKLGASATLGLLGSFFLPGGPIFGTMIGLSTGIVSESTQLKDFLFGKMGEDGNRQDNGIISKHFQNFFKDNKVGMGVGASAGVLSSIGLLPSFFVPGGPIGGVLIGTAISMAHKSGVFNDLIYGKDGSEDNVTGGITKFIKDHYKKDGNVKDTFMDAGMGAGVGILGSFFLPGGPITGALLGAATNIAINTDKFKDLLFGEKELDKDGNETGKRKGGLFGKFTTYIGDKVLLPLSKTVKETQIKMLGFFERNVANVLKVSIKPFQVAGQNFINGIKDTVGDIKQSFKDRVTKPIGDAVEEHILKPMRNAFKKIFGGLGKIIGSVVSAPFKMIYGAASSLNKTQVKKGQSDYNIDEALEAENTRSKFKQRHRLKELKRENKKKKHWKDVYDWNSRRKKNDTSKSEEDNGTHIAGTDPTDPNYSPILDGPKAYSDEDANDIYAELMAQNEDKYRESQKTTVSTSNYSGTGGNTSSTNQTEKSSNNGTKVSNNSGGTDISNSESGNNLSQENSSNSTVPTIPTEGLEQLSSYDNNEQKKSTFMDMVRDRLDTITNFFSSHFGNSPQSNSNGSVRETRPSMQSDLQFFAGGEEGGGNQTTASSANQSSNKATRKRNVMESDIHKIAESVDGQLNGVGYNVNKILRLLLKKNNMSDEDVSGENNKKYSRGGKLKRFLMKPFEKIKDIVMAPFTIVKGALEGLKDAVGGVIKNTVKGVTSIAKGILSLPKTLFKIGVTAVKGIAKGAGKVITTGLNVVGNVLVNAADGFGKMIGEASEGFGKLIGGALGGIGNLLHGLGIIGKELAPVLGKAISGIIKAPFKLAGMAGGFLSKFFKKKGKSGHDRSDTYHVIVDKYLEKNEILGQLKSIEFAILHNAPMDGEGPKYKGRTQLPVRDPSDENTQGNETRIALPYNMQFFANSGRNGNGLPNITRAETPEEERLQLDTRIAEGSASEMRERFAAEDDKKEERSFREKLLGLFKSNNTEQKKQGFNWSSLLSVIGKKGLLTGALVLALPTIIKHLPEIFNVIKTIGSFVGQLADSILGHIGSQGGAAGLVNGAGEQITSVANTVGLTDREEYVIGDNGQILTDENGNMVTEKKNDGIFRRIHEFFTPTETKIDHDTGIAYQEEQYDAVSRGKLHWVRGKVGKKIRKYQNKRDKKLGLDGARARVKVKNGSKNPLTRIKAAKYENQRIKTTAKGIDNAFGKQTLTQKAINKVKTTIANTKAGKKTGELISGAKTKMATVGKAGKELLEDKVNKILKYGDDALKFLTGKLGTFVKKYVKDGSKLDDVIKFVTKIFKKVFNVSIVTKFMSKFSKALSKIATMATTMATSEVFWGITGAVEGATNAAYTFEVDDSAVDAKMRAIAALFRALLATSYGSWVDIVDSIWYEISGSSFVNELAVWLYKAITIDEEDEKKLDQARKDFDTAYEAYLEEEYNAYVQNQEANGEAYMTLEEFKASNIATSRQEYNSEHNKSFFKRTWDFFHDGKTKQIYKVGWNKAKEQAKKGDFSFLKYSNYKAGRDYFFKNAFGWDLNSNNTKIKEGIQGADLSKFQWINKNETGGNGAGNETTISRPSTKLNGFTYYSQNDEKLKNQPYNQSNGTPGTMGQRGCGPTALSMVASELTGKDYDPLSMAKVAESTGYSTNVGTTTGYFGNIGTQLGMNVAEGQANPASIRQSLLNGNPVILQGTGGLDTPYTSTGHYVVGVGMKGDKVLVNDPRGPQYSKAYSMGDIMNGAAGMWSFAGKGGFGPTQEELKANAVGETGTSVSTSAGTEDAEKALVNAMYSVKDKLAYSMTGPRNPDKGSADCSSTVQWAYKNTVGIDPGGNTRAQIAASNGINVDSYNGGPPNEANLRPGDLLFYGKNGVHDPSGVSHVEMYVGNNKLMGHGGGAHGEVPGPTEKEMSSYRVNGYIGAKRFVGDGTTVSNNFSESTTSTTDVSGADATSTTTSSSDSSSFSLSNLIGGAIDAVSRGISNFFGMNKSSETTTTGSTATTEDPSSVATGTTSVANVSPDTAAKSIWSELLQKGYTKAGIAGLLGNLYKESGIRPNNLQDSGNKKLGLSDEEYTNQVDSGAYSNFTGDNIGYGLAQWTSSGRKQGLLNLAKSRRTSISDPTTQANFLYQELDSGYKGVSNVLKTTNSVYDAAKVVCTDFEKPKMKDSPAEQQERANYGQSYYDTLANYNPSQKSQDDLKASAVGETGGNGDGPSISRYQKGRNLGGLGTEPNYATNHQTIKPIQTQSYNSMTGNDHYGQSGNLDKVLSYLGKIVQYLESTSDGITQLNKKDFGGQVNYVSNPSYTNVNGGAQQSQQRDTSNYDLGRQIAQGQLV